MKDSRSKFFAYLSRLRWIKRWGLMRNAESENVMEHSWEVAVIAHLLAVIHNTHFGGDIDPNKVATAALFHDVSEVLTGDMPTPVKYYCPNLTNAYRQIEEIAKSELLKTLPLSLQTAYGTLINEQNLPNIYKKLIKAADTLSAYMKCLSELRTGNIEFQIAANQLESNLKDIDLPEVIYFIENFVPDCQLPLDSLLKQK
jgi:5'-deoxynucleotidase